MHEKYLSTFVFDPHPDIPHCVIRLTEPPFVGIRVCIGTRLEVTPSPDGKNLKFDYHVLENSEFNSENTEFVGLLGGIVLALIERAGKMKESKIVIVNYTNWKGVTADRRITPKLLYWGSNNYYQEPQWLLLVFDEDKQEERVYAMKEIHSWI